MLKALCAGMVGVIVLVACGQEQPEAKRHDVAQAGIAYSVSNGAPVSGLYESMPELSRVAPVPMVPGNTFEATTTNPVKKVTEEPVSTFSVDVDTASYAVVRRALNQGYKPEKDAVRTEELVNYFDYHYALPSDATQPFTPTIAVYPTPWNSDTKLIHIGIKGYDIAPAKKPAANLVFLVDVSGSMLDENKLPLLKNALKMLVNTLEENDTIGIVAYAGAAGVVLEPTKVKNKEKILGALDGLAAGGSTAGSEGIKTAYQLAQTHFVNKGVNRVILATDGDFNVGMTDNKSLKEFIAEKRKTGIYLSVLGFGNGNYNDALMQTLAQNGNGTASYIDNLNEARKVLINESSALLFPIANDVKIQVEFNPERVAEYRLIGYETRLLKREDFNNDKIDAGDIGAGHSVTALYEVVPVESKTRNMDDLRYQPVNKTPQGEFSKTQYKNEYAFLKIRYKLPKKSKSNLLEFPIGDAQSYRYLGDVSDDIRFATAVAAFGQVLRNDSYTKDYDYSAIEKLASTAKGQDDSGYRAEFINLVKLAKALP